jgi:hypothetical protein
MEKMEKRGRENRVLPMMFWRWGFLEKGGERTELHVLKKKKKKLTLFTDLSSK